MLAEPNAEKEMRTKGKRQRISPLPFPACTLPQVLCQTTTYCSGVPLDWQLEPLKALAP